MGFWDKETCEYCGGEIVDKKVDLPRKVKGGYVLIKHVPIGVCRECGTRYYSANVLKMMSQIIRRGKKSEKKLSMPVYTIS